CLPGRRGRTYAARAPRERGAGARHRHLSRHGPDRQRADAAPASRTRTGLATRSRGRLLRGRGAARRGALELHDVSVRVLDTDRRTDALGAHALFGRAGGDAMRRKVRTYVGFVEWVDAEAE